MIKPRLPSSHKWVSLPPELVAQIIQAFEQAFKAKLKGVHWYTQGFIYPEETILRIGFGKPNQLKHHHYMLSWDSRSDSPLTEQIHSAIDFIDQIISDHISGEQRDFPRAWKEVKTQIKSGASYFQYSTENLDLEGKADKLLGKSEEGLAQGDWSMKSQDEDPDSHTH